MEERRGGLGMEEEINEWMELFFRFGFDFVIVNVRWMSGYVRELVRCLASAWILWI